MCRSKRHPEQCPGEADPLAKKTSQLEYVILAGASKIDWVLPSHPDVLYHNKPDEHRHTKKNHCMTNGNGK